MSFDLKDYILVLDNVVPTSLCTEILKEYEASANWVNTTTGSGLNREIRRCDAINMTDVNVIQSNQMIRKAIDSKLYACAALAIRQYNQKFPFAKIEGDSGYTLLRYQENEFYKQHVDHFLQQPRVVSCSFALNDEYEGGEWCFFDRQVIKRVPVGSAIMFPSNFLYPHEILPVTKGVRYSIITWFI